jgi:hypothetical protein
VNVTWDSFTPSEVDMAKVASFPSIMLQRVDMCLERLDGFQQALRAPAIGMTLFSHAAGIFRRNFVALETKDTGFGEASIPEQ